MTERRQYVISFTDLVYAALLGYALQELGQTLAKADFVDSLFIVSAILYLIYDWYGEHSLEVNTTLGSLAIQFDFAALVIYFGLIYSGARASLFFSLMMALRAARGILINVVLLKSGNPAYGPRLKSYNVSSGSMAALYLAVFAIDVIAIRLSSPVRLAISFGLWAAAYAAALISERLFRRHANNRQIREGRHPPMQALDEEGDLQPDGLADNVGSPKQSTVIQSQEPVGGKSEPDKGSPAIFYDAISEAFDHDFYSEHADPCIAFDVESVWRIIQQHIVSGQRVLEVGCGTGYWLGKVSTEIGATVFGLDISQLMARTATQISNASILIAEASDLPFTSEAFDAIISPFNALDHCERYPRAFAEIERVLRPNGMALLMVDNRRRLIRRYWHLRTPNIKSLKGDPRRDVRWRHIVDGQEVVIFSHLYTIRELEGLLPGCNVQFVGIGIITTFVPRFVRRNFRTAVWWFLNHIGRFERLLGRVLPGRSAHIFIVAKKAGG
jgi:SAM-dependent methyltransferase